jgi:hypothetical protein
MELSDYDNQLIETPLINKSKYMRGQQCPKFLWLYNRNKLPEPTLTATHRFNQGHNLEGYVKQLFPTGIDLKDIRDIDDNFAKTKQLIKDGKTIFEAGIKAEHLYLKADILEPDGDGWNLYEIKASTKVKPEHYSDLAFQKHVCIKAGLKVNKCFVIYLNKEYVKNGEIKPEELITKKDVTKKVDSIRNIEENIRKYLKIIQSVEEPEAKKSKNCTSPYECPIKKECWSDLPEHNVFELSSKTAWELFDIGGVIEIKDIPPDFVLNPKDRVIFNACNENKTQISKDNIKYFMDSLNYPLYYLDFETFDTAVPIYDRSKPYQKIPFQYSLHIQNEDGKTDHLEFLNEDNTDPRPKLLKSLENQIGKDGNVVVYNKTFEIERLKALKEDFSEHRDWLENVINRIIDLASPFKDFDFYDPLQEGSLSLKKVLPAVTGKDYSDLEINNGEDASILYFYSHIEPRFVKKEEIRENLLKYCCLDTEGMVFIVEKLAKLLKE